MKRRYDSSFGANLAQEFAFAGAKAAANRFISRPQEKTSTKVVASNLGNCVSNAEGAERRRLPPSKYRLHAAKWLVMDKMLKNLFFPLQTSVLDFGISSFSGVGNSNFSDIVPQAQNQKNAARTRGTHRGLALFNLRITDDSANKTAQGYLNSAYVTVGKVDVSNGSPSIYSPYRRFHNQPMLQSGANSDGSEVIQTKCQTLSTSETYTAPTSTSPGSLANVRSLDVGITLSQMESVAAAAMVYADPVFNYWQSRSTDTGGTILTQRGETGVNAGEGASAHPLVTDAAATPQTNWLNSTNHIDGTDDAPCYLGAVQDAVMRIVDGDLVMDIMNTETTPAVIEVVIHSKKKNNMTKQQIYDQIFNDVERKMRRVNPGNGTLPGSAPLTGGWQAFYDPSYPLLRIPSGGNAASLVTEVHRSHHVLLPGQSKEVKISLGSLYYKMKNKNDTDIHEQAPNQIFLKHKDNVGSLYVAVGHSGFEYPQMGINLPAAGTDILPSSTKPSTTETSSLPQGNVPGTGFWVGRSRAPSSINISCKYTEKYYPLTFDRSAATVLASNTLARPSYLSGTVLGTVTPALPIASIQAERVATAGNEIAPVVKNSFRSEL